MAKFIELSSEDETYLVNVETISIITPWGKGSSVYTTCDKMPIVNVNQSYEFVKDAIFNITE